jgi:glyoxylase-like metal-dependent hydrolase (beta-lactamase superfamily II)
MRSKATKLAAAVAAFVSFGAAAAVAQTSATGDTPDAHLKLAKDAAGTDFLGTLGRLCILPATGPGADVAPGAPPPRETWYADPAKVFDNLYFVGGKIHSAWALTTSDGIILIDTIYPYNSEELIVGGLQKLGLDPKQVKYVIITHGHGDHVGGAKMMQDRFGSRIVMGEPDWRFVENSVNRYSQGETSVKPKRDIVAQDRDPRLHSRSHRGHVLAVLPGQGQRQAADRGVFRRDRVQLRQHGRELPDLHQLAAQDGRYGQKPGCDGGDVEPLRVRQCGQQDQDDPRPEARRAQPLRTRR